MIDGGFSVLFPDALKVIDGGETPWGTTAIERLVFMDELQAWRHEGFWQPMDTLREKELLDTRWAADEAPWKVWK